MASTYLSRDELAELVGCSPRSVACMRRWLDRHGWIYQENRAGFPNVSRVYHDERMLGKTRNTQLTDEPDFSGFGIKAKQK